jgi:hypothetical protein
LARPSGSKERVDPQLFLPRKLETEVHYNPAASRLARQIDNKARNLRGSVKLAE